MLSSGLNDTLSCIISDGNLGGAGGGGDRPPPPTFTENAEFSEILT